jgi:hypothetical protein
MLPNDDETMIKNQEETRGRISSFILQAYSLAATGYIML